MAAVTWYMTNANAGPHQQMDETSPGGDANSNPLTGWTVAKVAATAYSKMDSGVEQASTTFASTPIEPDGSIDTTVGDCLRTTNTYNGDFANANWVFRAKVIAATGGGEQDGRIGLRLFRDTSASGDTATQITAARVAGAVVTNLATTSAQTSNATFNPGAFTVTNEYLFLQLGWEITGAGNNNNRDVLFQIGTTATCLISADFTPVSTYPLPSKIHRVREWSGYRR